MVDVVALFWNRSQRRPRALWRFVLFGLLLVVAFAALNLAVLGLLRGPLRVLLVGVLGVGAGATGLLVQSVALTAAVVAAVGLAALFPDRRRLSDYGFHLDRDWWLDLGFGLALGGALMTVVFLVELTAGWLRVTGTFGSGAAGFGVGLVAMAVLYLLVGFYEELFARGYLLTNVAEGLDGVGPVGRTAATAVGVLVSAALFGLAHAGNPNATALSTFNVGLAGVMLAAGYVLTDDLAIPIGLHVAWNFFQGVVYGFPVSGTGGLASVFVVEETGPDVLTGGAFGPEAGLLGVAAIVAGTAGTAAYCRWRYGSLAVDPGVTTPELRWREE